MTRIDYLVQYQDGTFMGGRDDGYGPVSEEQYAYPFMQAWQAKTYADKVRGATVVKRTITLELETV